MGYINVIRTSLLLFPLLAIVLTIPYMVWMYRKYGAINLVKTLLIYSLVLYLESSFLLVILPLPDPASVQPGYLDMVNVLPFRFVVDFIKESPLQILEPRTYVTALKHASFFVPAFNVLMLLPLGLYLRYYFRCSLKKTVLLSALLNFFFEVTQLTGLFFHYDGAYRLADVDDLIQNTLGGVLGYYVAGFVSSLLPTREELDQAAWIKGQTVSGPRRFLSLMIDGLIIKLLGSLMAPVLPHAELVVFLVYFTFLPQKDGRTLGSRLLKFHFQGKDGKRVSFFFRSLGICLYLVGLPQLLFFALNTLNNQLDSQDLAALFFLVAMLFMVYLLATAFMVLTNRRLPFDAIGQVVYFSDLKTETTHLEVE